MLAPWKENCEKSRQGIIKKQRHHFADIGLSSQCYGFSSSHVWMWELDCEESWAPKNWWFWTVVLEKTPENPLDCKEIQPVHPQGDQSWVFIGRTDAKAETSILWPPNGKSWLIGKHPDAERDWGQEEKGTRGWDGWLPPLTLRLCSAPILTVVTGQSLDFLLFSSQATFQSSMQVLPLWRNRKALLFYLPLLWNWLENTSLLLGQFKKMFP